MACAYNTLSTLPHYIIKTNNFQPKLLKSKKNTSFYYNTNRINKQLAD
ncbi:MAG TPA: hypothetical protein DHV15_09150 [Treponema sp.]|uniref:Uncharacterized protein n=1 Tax=Treponema denticola (strain ATCC 35405 / DSM 14222 / CIP 103919 / JCM 8153 / KCTC 15104) TaxID=243275 RepID=Q73R22_TREDE|nr:hypothetical protein TDE_0271 [Treponema denticola ATCC 35405]HCY95661.1 hypothetical protein [Treponema sp.]